MAEQSPAQFAAKLRRLPQAVQAQQHKGIEARALVTKRIVLATAAGVRPFGKLQPKWVQYRIADDVAEVRLRGGFAHLTEKGSYKKPEGWDEGVKTVTARRTRSAAKKGITLTQKTVLHWGGSDGEWHGSVHHPALRQRPFWKAGIDAARVPGHKAYASAQEEAIRSVFR